MKPIQLLFAWALCLLLAVSASAETWKVLDLRSNEDVIVVSDTRLESFTCDQVTEGPEGVYYLKGEAKVNMSTGLFSAEAISIYSQDKLILLRGGKSKQSDG